MAKAYWINTFRVIHDSDRSQRCIELAGAYHGVAYQEALVLGDAAVRDFRIMEAIEG